MNVSRHVQTAPDARSSYSSLRDTAVGILAAAEDGLDDLRLAEALFGTGSAQRWTAMLAVVLGGDARIQCVGGRWRLAGRAHRVSPPFPPSRTDAVPSLVSLSDTAALSDSFVALALATTGADPRRHRIASIALVRVDQGMITGRLDALVNSGQRLAGFLRNAARVSIDELNDAPTFAEHVPTLRELIDRLPIVGYGIGRAQAFLATELRRAELPPLDVPGVELDTLVRGLLPATSKPGLYAAADELGVQHSGRSAPLAEAELIVRVVQRIHERVAVGPPRPLLVDETHNAAPCPRLFTTEWLATVPERPGVYVAEDADGQALYVGKARNLRQRLAGYVSRQPSLHRRLEALAVRAARIETLPTDSDLEAVLLEARLIRDYHPVFNVARTVRAPTTIVRAAPDARSPSVRLVGAAGTDGARYLGPFESVRAAREALAVARAAYPDAFARRLGDAQVQRQAVLDVCRLLSGQKGPTMAMLREQMQTAAQDGLRTEVERLRAALRAAQGLSVHLSELAGLAPGWRLLILDRPDEGWPGRLHLVQDGRLIWSADTDATTLPNDPARALDLAETVFAQADDDAANLTMPASWVADDTTILLRWLAQTRPRLDVRRLPATPCGALT